MAHNEKQLQYLNERFPYYMSYVEGGTNWSTQDVFEQKMIDMMREAFSLSVTLEGKVVDDEAELLRIYNRPQKDFLIYVRSAHNLKQLIWSWQQVRRELKENAENAVTG